MGDSIGRWEGDTLVVETTNFHPLQAFRGASETLKVTERFTRVDADTILYRFTIDDPDTWTRPWSGEVPFRRTDETDLRIRLPRGQLRPLEHPERRPRPGARRRRRRNRRSRKLGAGGRDQGSGIRDQGSGIRIRVRYANDIVRPRLRARAAWRRRARGGAPRVWRGVRSQRAGPPAGHDRPAGVGEPAHLDSHRDHQARWRRRRVWAVEGGTPNTLLRRGLTRDTLKIGTEIIVDGYQTKDHSLKRANGRDVTFTDGQKIFMGSSGTGAPRDGRDPTEVATDEEASGQQLRIGQPPQIAHGRRRALHENPIQRPAAATVNQSAERRERRSAPARRGCSASARSSHPPPDRQREDDGGDQRQDLHPERRAVVALDGFGQEQRHAGEDHHRDARPAAGDDPASPPPASAGRAAPAPAASGRPAAPRRPAVPGPSDGRTRSRGTATTKCG